jgi:hypothetical protein
MMRGWRMRRRAWILGGLLVLLATMGSVAWATTSASGKLVGCAKKSGGALRLVGTVKDCRKTERAVSWSPVGQPGPRGPAGARGPAGKDGADGIDGEDGLDGDDGADGLDGYDGADATVKWHYFFGTAVNVNSGTSLVPAGSCAGTPTPQAVNGGVKVTGLPSNVRVIASAPVGAATTATQWELQIENTSGSTQSVTPWVLCSAGTAG